MARGTCRSPEENRKIKKRAPFSFGARLAGRERLKDENGSYIAGYIGHVIKLERTTFDVIIISVQEAGASAFALNTVAVRSSAQRKGKSFYTAYQNLVEEELNFNSMYGCLC
ncbi:hypothetical protein QE152_g28427 [Popillia japonica]|uniref:Uncharacterized protein n=1 Tax=Popillia japonica TaxID=7064 RepID=A0AAW1JIS3_POPJA